MDYLFQKNVLIRFYANLIGEDSDNIISGDKDAFIRKEYYREGSPIHKSRANVVPNKKNKSKSKPSKVEVDRRKSYLDYLKSSKWKAFKLKLKKDRGSKCEGCGKTGVPLDGHHLTYERLFNELPEDIKLLCRKCHSEIHSKKQVNNKPNKKKKA